MNETLRQSASRQSSEYNVLQAADILRAASIVDRLAELTPVTLTPEAATVRKLVLAKASSELHAAAADAMSSAIFTWPARAPYTPPPVSAETGKPLPRSDAPSPA